MTKDSAPTYEMEGNVSIYELEDHIRHPKHYRMYPNFEVIDVTEHLNFNRGNIVKYVLRAGHKSSETELDDLLKAQWYIEREVYRVEREQRIKRERSATETDDNNQAIGLTFSR